MQKYSYMCVVTVFTRQNKR